jgi:ankyrin repeat protein
VDCRILFFTYFSYIRLSANILVGSPMNKFITAIKEINFPAVEEILKQEPKWLTWQEDGGKNALHFLGGVDISKFPEKEADSLQILKLLLKNGMDINSIHNIPDPNCDFPATPLWYAYTRGRNKTLYTYLLEHGANPENCMYAIAWYDDVEAAELFKKHGAKIEKGDGIDTPFIAAFTWRRLNVAGWLLKNGANVNAVDTKGNTALFYAVKRKQSQEEIELLLHYGSDTAKKNNEGISPKQLAEKMGPKRIFNLLESK